MDAGGDITVRLARDSRHFVIEIRDNGHGVPPEEQLDIFEPFYRGKQKKARKGGLGIGLPFSHLVACSLGGELTLKDSGPAGSTFALLIPVT